MSYQTNKEARESRARYPPRAGKKAVRKPYYAPASKVMKYIFKHQSKGPGNERILRDIVFKADYEPAFEVGDMVYVKNRVDPFEEETDDEESTFAEHTSLSRQAFEILQVRRGQEIFTSLVNSEFEMIDPEEGQDDHEEFDSGDDDSGDDSEDDAEDDSEDDSEDDAVEDDAVEEDNVEEDAAKADDAKYDGENKEAKYILIGGHLINRSPPSPPGMLGEEELSSDSEGPYRGRRHPLLPRPRPLSGILKKRSAGNGLIKGLPKHIHEARQLLKYHRKRRAEDLKERADEAKEDDEKSKLGYSWQSYGWFYRLEMSKSANGPLPSVAWWQEDQLEFAPLATDNLPDSEDDDATMEDVPAAVDKNSEVYGDGDMNMGDSGAVAEGSPSSLASTVILIDDKGDDEGSPSSPASTVILIDDKADDDDVTVASGSDLIDGATNELTAHSNFPKFTQPNAFSVPTEETPEIDAQADNTDEVQVRRRFWQCLKDFERAARCDNDC